MCLEPPLNNIKNDTAILPISSIRINKSLPKTYEYVDNVNATTKNNAQSLQALLQSMDA